MYLYLSTINIIQIQKDYKNKILDNILEEKSTSRFIMLFFYFTIVIGIFLILMLIMI